MGANRQTNLASSIFHSNRRNSVDSEVWKSCQMCVSFQYHRPDSDESPAESEHDKAWRLLYIYIYIPYNILQSVQNYWIYQSWFSFFSPSPRCQQLQETYVRRGHGSLFIHSVAQGDILRPSTVSRSTLEAGEKAERMEAENGSNMIKISNIKLNMKVW